MFFKIERSQTPADFPETEPVKPEGVSVDKFEKVIFDVETLNKTVTNLMRTTGYNPLLAQADVSFGTCVSTLRAIEAAHEANFVVDIDSSQSAAPAA